VVTKDAVAEAWLLLALAAMLFIITSALLPSLPVPGCIEGGTYVGFPLPVLVTCRGGFLPGGGTLWGTPQWNPGGFVVDLSLWVLASWGLVRLYRRVRSPAA